MDFEWRSSTWGEEISLEYGKAIRGYQEARGAFRVFGSNGPVGWTDNALADGPGVILGRKGAYRGVRFSLDPFWVIDTAYYVAPKKPFDIRWLYYAIKHYKLGEIDDGSPIPSTTRAAVYVQELSVPPLEDQRAISRILGAIDDRIDNLEQTNAVLEAIAQALFKSWFVDFDPVREKAVGREPEGMGAATAALFPSEFEDSEIGPIPKGWRVEEAGQVVSCVGGATPSTKDEAYWSDGAHHWATPKDLSGLQAPVLTTTDRLITAAGLARISSGLLPTGTLLMSSRAPIGYLAIAAIPTAINQGFIAMPPGGLLPPTYLLFWARSNMGLIKQKANGSTFMEISKSAFRTIKLCVPSAEVVSAFSAIAGPLLRRIELNEFHKASLAEVRDTLLPRLVSGKLRLPDAQALVDEAIA